MFVLNSESNTYTVWFYRPIAKILRCVFVTRNRSLSSVTFKRMALCSNRLRTVQTKVYRVLKFGTGASFLVRVQNSFIGCIRALSVNVHGYKHMPHIRKFVLRQHFVQVQKLRCAYHGTNLKALQEAEMEELKGKLGDVYCKIMFNSVIEFSNFKGSWKKRRVVADRQEKLRVSKINDKDPLANIPVTLKYLRDMPEIHKTNESPVEAQEEGEFVCLPYSIKTELDTVISSKDQHNENKEDTDLSDQSSELSRSSWNQLPETMMCNSSVSNWMSDYECYDESEDGYENHRPWELNYGTPDASVPISDVPCGGCGALLHCQDPAVPGYLPSELFKPQDRVSLRAVICQRCHFLRFYDTALNVIVSPDDYPKLMAHLKEKVALIVLMIDLLDFPCSIWPGIMNIIGHKQPVVVVGNKVDLLPADSRGYLHHIQKCLAESLTHTGIPSSNIKHVALLSAKTGYGVEELITKLHNLWEYRGDVYLLGCTNVGKSTLFNALLQSDYCKVKAVDLIQRATTSPWPGTTINLLKFPVMRLSGWCLAERTKRLISQRQQVEAERRLQYIQSKEDTSRSTPALIGHIGMTFQKKKKPVPGKDIFSIHQFPEEPRPFSGLDPLDEEYAYSKWCYDTPGVVHPEQVIHLLTTEELMMTLPKKLILPRTFCMQPNTSLFIAGLGRLDYMEGVGHIRMTVFSSGRLPITICKMDDADYLYKTLLGTRLLGVPRGGPSRLAQWPMLKAHPEIYELHGTGWKKSCGDIVLSSSGWIAVTFGEGNTCKFKAWTPGGRGVYLRCPALLPFAVTMCGPKIRRSLAHSKGKGMFWKDV